jgi:hypothetical protein
MPSLRRAAALIAIATSAACLNLSVKELASTPDAGGTDGGEASAAGDAATDGKEASAAADAPVDGAASCPTSAPEVLANGQLQPSAIAIDQDNVYWVTLGNNLIESTAKAGGKGVNVLVGTPIQSPGVLALDPANVYYTYASEVTAVSKSTGNPVTGWWVGGQTPPHLVIDGTSGYFTDNAGGGTGVWTFQTNAGGATPTLLASVASPLALAVDVSQIYASSSQGGVYQTSKAGSPAVVFSDRQLAVDLAVDTDDVYWVTSDGNVVAQAKASDGGASAPVILASRQDSPAAIALDASSVYWITSGGGTVMSVPKTGGAPCTLAHSQAAPGGLAVDGTGVYWTNEGDGTVMVIRR